MRTALVTGASSGIGAACALAFARRGDALLLCARRTDRLEEVAVRAREAGAAAVETFELDVRDRASVDAWSRDRAASLAKVDVLVNNAGLARGFGTLVENDPADWDEMIDTNVKGLLDVTRVLLPHLIARKGHVVNIGSVAGRWVYPKGAVYCASKFAERAITEGMRLDLLGTGVRVTTVDPGMVDTEFSLVRFHGDEARASKVYDGMTPLSADDVAEVVIFPTDQASTRDVHRR